MLAPSNEPRTAVTMDTAKFIATRIKSTVCPSQARLSKAIHPKRHKPAINPHINLFCPASLAAIKEVKKLPIPMHISDNVEI